MRSIFERAVTAVGLHMTKGQIVWEAFREFENAILSTLQVGRILSSLWKHLRRFSIKCQQALTCSRVSGVFVTEKRDIIELDATLLA